MPSNTLITQLKIFTPRDYSVLILLSGLSALFMTMQIYVTQLRKKVGGVGRTIGGGLGAFIPAWHWIAFVFLSRSIPLRQSYGRTSLT